MKGYNSISDQSPRAAWATEPPDQDQYFDVLIPANTMQRFAIPASANIITYGVYVGNGAFYRVRLGDSGVTVQIPTATSALGAGVGGELMPGYSRIPSGPGIIRPTHMALISPQELMGFIAFWA